ncbi:MAG: hypothetical protein CR980_00450 [Propionibacteriales bacterium]|nr:MAG: hypothetical protein CR980_00450 [Propionibacteriales bacterium]
MGRKTLNARRWVIVGIALLAILGVVATGLFVSSRSDSTESTQKQATKQSAPASSAAPKPDKDDPQLKGCLAEADDLMPNEISIPELKLTSKVIPAGLDKEGRPAAPPKDDSQNFTWYNGSAKPGSASGNALLNVHAYPNGKAVGNMLTSKNGLKPNQIIRVAGKGGKTVCYRVTKVQELRISEYDVNNPKHIEWQRFADGPSRLVIITCKDRNAQTKKWDTRSVFWAERVSA